MTLRESLDQQIDILKTCGVTVDCRVWNDDRVDILVYVNGRSRMFAGDLDGADTWISGISAGCFLFDSEPQTIKAV